MLYEKKVDFMLCTPTYDGNYGETNFSTNMNTEEERKELINMLRNVWRVVYTSKVPVQTNPISLDFVEEYYAEARVMTKFKL